MKKAVGNAMSVGTRNVEKDSPKIGAIGTLDEANSFLGLAASFCQERQTTGKLKKIQKDLMVASSILAGKRLSFGQRKVQWLEKEIVLLEKSLPILGSFLLPGGARLSGFLQVARSVVRRAEREAVAQAKTEGAKPAILSYLNRLSSFLFLLAREANVKGGIAEEKWTR